MAIENRRQSLPKLRVILGKWMTKIKGNIEKIWKKLIKIYFKRRVLMQTLIVCSLISLGCWGILQFRAKQTTLPLVFKESISEEAERTVGMISELQKEINELRKKVEEIANPREAIKEKVFQPLALVMPTKGKVVRKNGWEKMITEWRYHSGIDIFAPVGSKVVAVAEGQVKEVRSDSSLRTIITLEHGSEWLSLYAHIKSVQVSVGQIVKQGTVLGYTSLSTCGPEPGIHFNLFHKGKPVDPLTILTDLSD
jgi:murein DD-endopeptidase MepM/ murein hydrolase activator NlpD